MIRALLLCGVLSVGSAWGQGSLPPCEPDGQGGYKMSIGGACVIPSAEQYNLVQSPRTGAVPQSGGDCLGVLVRTKTPGVWRCVQAEADPETRAALSRIESMLRAICENTRHSNGLALPDCPKETKP